jgi:acyl transferase domain-containing protein/3-hydroxymyristoyl/3-hydroxydecanoyl-(acyl carrier protein) dehydratase/1-acyl-sn-glycerol-3-phosphate acyltransferase
MMRVEDSVVIIGRGCILPGALDPDELWTRIVRRDDLASPSTRERWGLSPAAVCADPIEPSACARGGYVTGFEPLADDAVGAVPEGWHWLVAAVRQALREAGTESGARTGLALGTLGYPTRELADIAAARWGGDAGSSGPAMAGQTGALRWAMKRCGLEGPGLALDAACASGLYALKIACDRLRAGDADVMLAAGLNAADDLFLHIGFTALGALSPSGRSAPLSTHADGLLPAHGAAVVALKRLADAARDGDRILAIVRGVGLSNDGRGPGLLAPVSSGQQRAMRAAFAPSGVSPADVAYLESHATGTTVGDREEIVSIRALFGDSHPLRLGSLKAQMGHLITASATAGLLKLCAMFEHEMIPAAPRISVEHPLDALQGSALTLPAEALPWRPATRSRVAAINAFGFGGCNAHAILEGPEGVAGLRRGGVRASTAPARAPMSLVACEVAVGTAGDTDASLRVLLGAEPPTRRAVDIELALSGLGFPPADLEQALAGQLLLLRAAQVIRPHLREAEPERLGVFIGTDIDPAGARHGFRRRMDVVLGRPCSDRERNTVVPPIEAATVVGTMPNMPANRLNSLLNARGPGFTVSDGAASGVRALELAADALAAGEIDAALVGAVDASGGAFGDDPTRADAVVLMLLVRSGDEGGRAVLATLDREPAGRAQDNLRLPWTDAGTAADLLHVAVAAMCCRHGLLPENPALPWLTDRRSLNARGWRVTAAQTQGLAFEAPAIPLSKATPAVGRGELAWVFTGAAAAYPGAGVAMLRAFPEIADGLFAMAPRLAGALQATLGSTALSCVEQLQISTLVSQSHARLLALAGLRPDATIGLSSGETNALLATGAWTDPDALFAEIAASGLYDEQLGGRYEVLRQAWGLDDDATPDWRSFRLVHPVAAVREALPSHPRVRLLIVHHDADAVIGGDAAACRALIDALGAQAAPIGHDLVVHCPEIEPFAEVWRRVHHRTTRTFAAPRLYANAINRAFVPSDEACAELLTAQARTTVLFHKTLEQAYADGVRGFVELGPRAACSGWIREVLGRRPHVASALDGTSGTLSDIAAALTNLAAAGYPVDVEAWNARMRGLRVIAPARDDARAASIRIRAHRAQPQLDTPPPAMLQMPPAPRLASVLAERLRPVFLAQAPALQPADVLLHEEVVQLGPVLPSVAPVLALAALERTQQALLQAQELAIQHLFSAPQASSLPPPRPPRPAPARHAFTREQLEIHASGRISEIFGPRFVPQDGYRRQVRMPTPPLLLADRVTDLRGEPGSMGTGVVWTETDVRPDAWYLHHGRMPAGILIESGQADLFLISWLGIDLHNRGNRVYRLLGCELTFHGRLPAAGETLRYEIAIDGHARHGGVGLFFFHYDCHSGNDLRLSVRNGQAGFFTDEELAESAGVLWDPEEDVPDPSLPVAPPRPGIVPARSYDERTVAAFAAGDLYGAFGRGFERAASHTRSPRIPGDRMRLFDRVDELDTSGGPWGRGYLRATMTVRPDAWFFQGHFHNDPCMPGTLMFEGALQAMVFYLSALGYSIDRDGWSFEPETDISYTLRCRGQVTPASKELVCEVFVAELHDGPEPVLVADLMGTIDGLRSFHCRRMRLTLVPDYPLDAQALRQVAPDAEPVAGDDGFRYGQASLLACALGHPADAFGELYASLPPALKVPRLPAPPYHFISRVASVCEPPGGMRAGVAVETDYDIPADAWYFAAHPAGRMPTCVLVEVALQPCGWLASYVGCAVHEPGEVFFRNLDGAGVLRRMVGPDDGAIRVRSTLTRLSRAGGITLVSFDVVCSAGGDTIYELTTTFGFFPTAALAQQAGLRVSPEQRALAGGPRESDLLDMLGARALAQLPVEPLRMCQRVTHRQVASDGRASLRGERTVTPGDWYFRAHFFQDPVQPGSLGIEALVQLLRAHLLLDGAAETIADGGFVDFAGPETTTWQFRGQVRPEATLITLTLEAAPIERHADRWTVRGDGSLWVDGCRIYEARGLTVTFAAGLRPAAVPGRQARDVAVMPGPDIDAIDRWWRDEDWRSESPDLQALFMEAVRHFAGAVDLLDPPAIEALRGTPLLLVANHQVAIESLLASVVLPPVIGRPLTTIAKDAHRETWVGRLAAGLDDRRRGPSVVYVDRQRGDQMLERLADMRDAVVAGRRSLMVHVEGTRARRGGQPVGTISAVWSDLAVEAGLTVVPIRFCGGLPMHGVADRLEFPYGYGPQSIVVGRPVAGTDLASLPLNARRERLLAGLAELDAYDFEPRDNAAFATRVAAARGCWSLDEVRAVFLLLQAAARGWALDEEGLPSAAMAHRDAADPFWAWFDRPAHEVHTR